MQTERVASAPDSFGVRKPTWMIERYRELAPEFPDADMIELGIDQGASTAMLALLFRPRRLAAFDIAPGPIDALDALLADRGLSERIRLHWAVDQSDTTTMRSLVDAFFGDTPLDLVIDDASHRLAPTRASFELLFPCVRPGGLFIIEDWSHDHQRDRRYQEAIDDGSTQGQKLLARIAEGIGGAAPTPALSQLVLELVVVAAHSPEIVADLRIRAGWCEVRRGPAPLDYGVDLRAHLGSIGRRLLPEAPAAP